VHPNTLDKNFLPPGPEPAGQITSESWNQPFIVRPGNKTGVIVSPIKGQDRSRQVNIAGSANDQSQVRPIPLLQTEGQQMLYTALKKLRNRSFIVSFSPTLRIFYGPAKYKP